MPFDTPKAIDYPGYAQAEFAHKSTSERLQSESIVIREKGAGAKMNTDETSKNGEVTDRGQISRMRLPQGWLPNQKQEGVVGNSSYIDYCSPASKEIKLSFFYRGRPVSAASAETFHELLNKPAHTLTPAEIKSIGEIMRDRKNPADFQMLSARTEVLNGKKVLVVEGRYNEIQQDTYAVFVDADGKGKAVQEIYFQAPKADYMKHSKEAKDSIKTIEWKT